MPSRDRSDLLLSSTSRQDDTQKQHLHEDVTPEALWLPLPFLPFAFFPPSILTQEL